MLPDAINNTRPATDFVGATLGEEFSGIHVGKQAHFRKLTLFPLMRSTHTSEGLDYLLLEDAITQGFGRVTEIHQAGSVSELRFDNSSDLPVLLLGGEELIGAKQNRVLNLTILAPPKQTTIIPVSCVEAGRWSTANTNFRSSDNVMHSHARAQQVMHVTQAMRASGSHRSNQYAVWGEIAAKMQRLDAASPTQAMSAIYERQATAVEEYVRAFQWQDHQAGIVFAINGRVLGLDLFDNDQVMCRFFPKFVRSFALDAIDAAYGGSTPNAPEANEPAKAEAVTDFLAKITSAPSSMHRAIGIGKDIRFGTSEMAGAGLWAKRYIHICAFAQNGRDDQTFQTRMSRPAHRRMW